MMPSAAPGPWPAEARAAGEALFKRRWHFVMSVPALQFLPAADRSEIAFAGRSNVGKSSLINALIGQGSLARTSNTPGRTQELNYYASEAPFYLVDMPGYGFAKAPKEKVSEWTELVRAYLKGRPNLKRVFLLIDGRHGIKSVDAEIMALLDAAGVPYQTVLTKTDKNGAPAVAAVAESTRLALVKHPAAMVELIETSAEKRSGLEELRAAVAIAIDAHAPLTARASG